MRLWDSMGSLFLTDEELGKKDDDHNLPKPPSFRSPPWAPARTSPRRSAKRLALACLAGFLVYLFIKNIPTDVPVRDRRRPVYDHIEELPTPFDPRLGSAGGGPPPPKIPPKQLAKSTGDGNYNGPIRFFNLATSLQAIAETKGGFMTNKNVLFAASSLQSVSTLLPVACRMGSELRSYVHFALMSRSGIDLDELRRVNGIDESCQVIFHGTVPSA